VHFFRRGKLKAAITLCDLDDTLFSTKRKCPPHVADCDLVIGAWGVDGIPISYATPAQHRITLWFQDSTVLVPVTARSTDALHRTHIKFDFAISAHGGVVLQRGFDRTIVPDEEWQSEMRARLTPCRSDLSDIVTSIASDAGKAGVAVRCRVVEENGLSLYVVVKHSVKDGNDAELVAVCSSVTDTIPKGWTVHVNGNNVAYLPPGLGKAHAVAWLLPQLRALYPEIAAIGIGDSFTDAGFMALCDFAMVPSQSQLASLLFS